jgi:hypothetical protein
MEQTAGEIQENIDGTNSGFQDFDSTNYRYVLGDLGILFGSLCDRFIPTENRAIALI